MRIAGLMSGTSLDGIDVAIVDIDQTENANSGEPRWRVVSFFTRELEPAQRDEIHDAIVHGNAAALCRLHARLGEWFAQAVRDACLAAGLPLESLDLIGSHGQTIWHEPP